MEVLAESMIKRKMANFTPQASAVFVQRALIHGWWAWWAWWGSPGEALANSAWTWAILEVRCCDLLLS